MKINKKSILIAVAVAVALLIVIIIVKITGSKDEEQEDVQIEVTTDNDDISENKVEDREETSSLEGDLEKLSGDLSDTIDPSVWEFELMQDGQWSTPEPWFNLLGDEALYSYIRYSEDEEISYYYYDDQLYKKDRRVYGDYWRLTAHIEENPKDIEYEKYIRDLRRYVEASGGEMKGLTNDGIVFVYKDLEEQHWWIEVKFYSGTLDLFITKEREIRIGEQVVINTQDYPNGSLNFTVYNDDSEYLSAEIDISKGWLGVDIYQYKNIGSYERKSHYSRRIESEKTTHYELDDIPKDEGVSYWNLSWREDEADPVQITLTLSSLGQLDEIKYQEAYGAILIKAKYAKSINLRPVGNDSLRLYHPEYDEDSAYMDKTAEGDYLVYVPAGNWIADITPKGTSSVSSYSTGLIPVNAGEITEIEIPLSTETALDKSVREFNNQQGLKIDKVQDQGLQVMFDFTLVDKETKTILPDITNTEIQEGGVDVEILDIKPIETPPSVVLLLDSSGSMKGQMNETLDAAKTFIEGLPEETFVQLIDFDDEPRLIEGTTKDEALKGLDKIAVGGSTALYDSIVLGLSVLEDLERPTLVTFTDGEDENHTVPGSGSVTSKEEAIKIVEDAGIQVMTIGFGEGHDSTTLEELAAAGFGQYFEANNQEALTKVFDAINEKLNSTYTATYVRPTQSAPSDVPVVNLIIDISGSMDSDWNEDCGYRLEKMKNLMHDFVLGLPEDAQIQVMAFNNEVFIKQIMTSDKKKILNAIGELSAGGGTNILHSLEAGVETLDIVPSSKKMILYLTDAALGVEEEHQDIFDELLTRIDEDQMNVLWIGLGEDLDETDFIHAANLSNGEYIVSEDADLLSEAADRLLNRIDDKKDILNTTIALQIVKEDDKGLLTPYSVSELVELSPIPQIGNIELSESVNYIVGKKLKQYDSVSAEFITGDALPKEAVKILKRIPLDESRSNEAATIHASEMLYLSMLNGVEAPRGQRFVVLLAEATNIMPLQEVVVYPDGSGHPANWVGEAGNQGVITKKKIAYKIPDVFSHFSLSYNNDGMYPLSNATWITNKPIVNPGTAIMQLNPDETVEGALVFLVPDEAMEQISLHYYDTDYGHIHMPIVGEMNLEVMEIDKLPEKPEAKLSDSFSIKVTGESFIDNVNNMIEATESNHFDIVEANFVSKVQANISVDASKRMLMGYPTTNGMFMIPMSAVTELVPFGMLNDILVSPGANNNVRYGFHTPKSLEDSKAELFIDLADVDGEIDVREGFVYDMTDQLGYGTHEYANITVNNLFANTESVAGHNANYVIADITIEDVKDGFASRGLISQLMLVQEGHTMDELLGEDKFEAFDRKLEKALSSGGLSSFSNNSTDHEFVLEYSDKTEEMILGLTDDSIIYDGTKRRGFVTFRTNKDTSYTLNSPMFSGLNAQMNVPEFDYGLLTNKLEYSFDNTYQKELKIAIDQSINQFKLKNPVESISTVQVSDLDDTRIVKQEIPVPMSSIAGSEKLNGIDSVEELKTIVSNIEVKNSYSVYNDDPYRYKHSAEAVLTQGWGSIGDVTNLVIKGLTLLGYNPERRVVMLTDDGRNHLAIRTNEEENSTEQLAAITYIEGDKEKVWVVPFNEELKQLEGKCYYLFGGNTEIEQRNMTLSIEYLIEPTDKNLSSQVSDASNALSGGSVSREPFWEEVFNQRLSLENLSLDAIDIGVTINQEGYTPRVTTARNIYDGYEGIDKNEYNIKGIRIELDFPSRDVMHETILPDKAEIEDLFITAGINLPDLKKAEFEILINKAEEAYQIADNPNELSALRWNARKAINQFIHLQSTYELEIADNYGLNLAHIDYDKSIIVTQLMNKGELQMSMNLLNPVSEVIGSYEELEEKEELIKSYNIMAGINASMLESKVLTNGYGFMEIWAKRPDGSEFAFLYPSEDREAAREVYLEVGMKESMVEYLVESDNYMIIQEQPSIINGEQRWAWLEINPDTYETIGMLDTLEHGSMVTQAIIEYEKNAAYYVLGAMVGVDSSIWAVCAFTLHIPDYEEMKKAAFAFAYGLADNATAKDGKGSVDIGGSPEISQSLGPIKISLNQGGLGVGDNVLGYSNGFKKGVEMYFQNMN